MQEQLAQSQKMQILVVVLGALFLGALDQTIVSAAAPQIVDDLGGMDRFTWLSTAYLLSSTALVPIYGKLADVYPKKNMAIASVTLFVIGSLLCGVAGMVDLSFWSIDRMMQLMIARFMQGVGGAGLFTMAFVIIANMFPPAERGKYQGYTGAVFAASSILGPTLGGLLSDYGNDIIPGISGWRYIFLINIPLGALILYQLNKRIPSFPTKSNDVAKLDIMSAVLLFSAVSAFLVAIENFKTGVVDKQFILLFSYAVVAGTWFVLRTLRASNPILSLRIFSNKVVTVSTIALFLSGGSFVGMILFEPLYQVQVLGRSSAQAGMSLIAFSLGIVAGSVISGKQVAKSGHYKNWLLGGLVVLLPTIALLAFYGTSMALYQRIVLLFCCGMGFGPTMPLYSLAVQNAVPPHQIGQATAACQFFRQMGGVIFSAVLGSLLIYFGQTATAELDYAHAIFQIQLLLLGVIVVAIGITFFLKEIPLRKQE